MLRLLQPIFLTLLAFSLSFQAKAENAPIAMPAIPVIPSAPTIAGDAYLLIDFHSNQVLASQIQRNALSLPV